LAKNKFVSDVARLVQSIKFGLNESGQVVISDEGIASDIFDLLVFGSDWFIGRSDLADIILKMVVEGD
jgi:hypothetical protein